MSEYRDQPPSQGRRWRSLLPGCGLLKAGAAAGQEVRPLFSVLPFPAQVTLIPTFDSLVMHEWYTETLEQQQELGVTVLGSNSTVAMQDETFPACKVEF